MSAPLEVTAVDGAATAAAWSPGGQWIALCEDDAVTVRDVGEAEREVLRVATRGRVSAGWCGDELVAALSEDGALRAWWVPDGGEAQSHRGAGRIDRSSHMGWRDGHVAFVRRGASESAVEVCDLARGDRWTHQGALVEAQTLARLESVAVHPDGHTFAATFAPGSLSKKAPTQLAIVARDGAVTWCALDTRVDQWLHLDWLDATTLLAMGVDSAWNSALWRVDLDIPERPTLLRRQPRPLPGTGPTGPSSFCAVDAASARVAWSLGAGGGELRVETFSAHAPDEVVTGRLPAMALGATAALHAGHDRLVVARHLGDTGDVTLHTAGLDGRGMVEVARVRLASLRSYGLSLLTTRDAAMVSVGVSPADRTGWRVRTGWCPLST